MTCGAGSGKAAGIKKDRSIWLVHKMFLNLKRLLERYESILPALKNGTPIRLNTIKLPLENKPGKELKSWSYSVKEVTDLLGVDEYLVYDLLKKNQMEAVIVDYWKRIPKESFQNWYKSQSRYRTKEDREKDALLENATITMPEMAQLLGTTRSSVYTICTGQAFW